MLEKIIYLTAFLSFWFIKDGLCDPISAIIGIASSLGGAAAGVGATLGPAGVLAAGGLGMSAMSMMNSPDKPGAVDQPTPPDPNAAADAAQAKLTQQRQTLLLSGGQTTLTGIGGSPLLGADLKSKTLLGA
jgi:hypothetical protein